MICENSSTRDSRALDWNRDKKGSFPSAFPAFSRFLMRALQAQRRARRDIKNRRASPASAGAGVKKLARRRRARRGDGGEVRRTTRTHVAGSCRWYLLAARWRTLSRRDATGSMNLSQAHIFARPAKNIVAHATSTDLKNNHASSGAVISTETPTLPEYSRTFHFYVRDCDWYFWKRDRVSYFFYWSLHARW